MERLVYTRRWKVTLWSIISFDAYIYGRIYFVKHWYSKPYFEVRMIVPYLPSTTYDGEYATNRRLTALSESYKAEMEVKAETLYRRYRYFKKKRHEQANI